MNITHMQTRPLKLIHELMADQEVTARERSLRRFARELEWEPSDFIVSGSNGPATSHLVAEYGLQQTTVLTFLREDRPFASLGDAEKLEVLSVSYNNAVDWHLVLDISSAAFLHNRLSDPVVRKVTYAEDADCASSRSFLRYTGAKVRPRLQKIDETVIETIDYWRRRISAVIKKYDITANLSALFNSIIFARVLEDQATSRDLNKQLLVSQCESKRGPIRDILKATLRVLGKSEFPKFLRDKQPLLDIFGDLPTADLATLLRDFYENSRCPYRFNFAMISRHALSIIYERYVSLLRESSDSQQHFFPLAQTVSNRSLGTVYTPQFIARFFARYLLRQVSPARLLTCTIVDPACGSGVFLRCVAEVATDASALFDEGSQKQVFRNLRGYDIDGSAVDAAQLSLSLLHIAHFGEFPRHLSIEQAESLTVLANTEDTFGAMIANPPFIPWDSMSPALRDAVVTVLGPASKGKADAYQAFIKVAMERLDNDGYLLFVLPQTFLSATSAAGLRMSLFTDFSIEVIADLSSIPVFEDTGAYVILLVARKRPPERQQVTIVRCRDFPGQALQEALHGRKQDSEFYQVFQVPQASFADPIWQLLPPREMELLTAMRRHPRIASLAHVRSGMVSGGRALFTVGRQFIPESDLSLWKPLLADREMRQFAVPEDCDLRVFFPIIDGEMLSEEQIRAHRWTWDFLSTRREKLSRRAAVVSDGIPWWRPHRLPLFLLAPKIIAPHVVRSPRFGYDYRGRYIVTQGPVIQIRQPSSQDNLEWYLLAILNSAVVRWQIQRFASRYARGYCLLEPKTLDGLHIPDPGQVSVRGYAELVSLAKRLAEEPEIAERDLQELDTLVMELYQVPSEVVSMMLTAY